MTREEFDRRLRGLEEDLIRMGGMVGETITGSVDALKTQDVQLAQQIIRDDDIIDDFQYELEERALTLIATQQPMAGDLRLIASIITIANELERIADYARGISTITIRSASEPFVKPLIDIPRMANQAREMLHGSLEAFISRDVEWAAQIDTLDDNVDALYDQVYRELLTIMMENPRTITRATYLLWVAHNLERIADRTTNICERVIFLVTGRQRTLNDGDEAFEGRVAPDHT
jgi:phosphate transport system protein